MQPSPAVAADVSATLSLQAAIQLPVSGPQSPPLCSPPVKAGILPPTANVNVNSSSVGASSAVTQTNKGWKEFEEALSEEFVSSSSSAAAVSYHQSKDAVPSSYVQQQQPLRARMPSLMMPSTAALYTLHLACFGVSQAFVSC